MATKFENLHLVSALAKSGGHHFAVMIRYDEALATGSMNDIDILSSPQDVDSLRHCVQEGLHARGLCLYNDVRYDYLKQFFYFDPGVNGIVQLDFMMRLTYRGIPFMPLPLDGSQIELRDGVPVVRVEWMVAYVVVRNILWRGKMDERYRSLADEVRSRLEGRAILQSICHQALGAHCAANIDAFIDGQGGPSRARAVRAFLWRRFTRSPLSSVIGLFRHFSLLAQKYFAYPGLMMVVLGPDGCGKSTVMDVVERDQPFFRKMRRYHFTPAFLSRYRNTDGVVRVVTDPHGQKRRGVASSVAKLAFLWGEYSLGFLFRIWKRLETADLVVFDRYYHDMLIDPCRYRYGAPMWMARLVGKLIPKPDLWVLLDAPAEVLQARKHEVPLEESARQRQAYRAFVDCLPNGVIIDASQPVESVAEAVKMAILQKMESRTAARRF